MDYQPIIHKFPGGDLECLNFRRYAVFPEGISNSSALPVFPGYPEVADKLLQYNSCTIMTMKSTPQYMVHALKTTHTKKIKQKIKIIRPT